MMDKLRELSVTPEMYLLEWFYTLFVRCVGIEHVGRVWDYVFVEGDTAYSKLAVGILMRMQEAILAADMDAICRVFDMVPYYVGDVSDLLKCTQKVNLAESVLKGALRADS